MISIMEFMELLCQLFSKLHIRCIGVVMRSGRVAFGDGDSYATFDAFVRFASYSLRTKVQYLSVVTIGKSKII